MIQSAVLRRGLRTKIIAWSFVPTVIILVAVALVTFYAYQRVTEELVIQRDQEVVRLAAGQLSDDLEEYAGVLTSLVRTADIYKLNQAAQQAALKRAANRLAVFDGGVVILTHFGMAAAAEPERPEILRQDWSNRTYFREALRSRRLVVSNIVGDGPQGAEVVIVAVPITGEQGEFRGVMAGMFRVGEITVSPFYDRIRKLGIEETGRTYLVDGTGRVIYYSDAEHIGGDFSAQAVVQRVLNREAGAIRTAGAEGVGGTPPDIVAGFAPVPGTPWGLVTEENWATLTSGSRRYQQFLLFLLALGVVVPAVVVAVGVRRITQPILELIGAAQRVAEGDFGQAIAATTGDELEALAEQFNRMSSQLQESYAYLEQRVADRTRELAALYDVTAVASESLDLEVTLECSLDQVLAAMESEVGAIHLVDEAEEMLRLAAWRGIPTDVVAEVDTVPLGGGLTSWVIEHGQPLVVPEIASGPRPLRAIPARGAQAYIGAPMRARGRVSGVLSVVGDEGRQFSVEEVALLASIADQVAIAIENAQLYQQAEQLAVMKERSRLARELHDSVTQSLYSLTLYAEASRRLVEAGNATQAAGYLTQLGETAQQALREMRLLVYQLRPSALETEGLVGALQQRLEAVERRAGVDAQLAVDGTMELPAPVETGLYRIAQEALNNALKHAAATKVTIRICATGDRVELEIADDGRGFDTSAGPQNGGLGLHTMRERVEQLDGTLSIQSKPGQGTHVHAMVPVNGTELIEDCEL